MEDILNEIIERIRMIKLDDCYKYYDDYVCVGIDEGVDRAIDIIKEYL